MGIQKNTLNMIDIQQLIDNFAIENIVNIKQHNSSGLLYLDIKNEFATATIQLQGANVSSWIPNKSVEVIWLSDVVKFKVNKSIRGGIPICWPWFGAFSDETTSKNNNFPAHGFARMLQWQIKNVKQLKSGETQVILFLAKEQIPVTQWSFDTSLECIFTIGASLELELITTNHNQEKITIGEALHSYFNVSDVRNIIIDGLDECSYLDKLDNFNSKKQSGSIEVKREIDRVYTATDHDCYIEDLGYNRRITIFKKGSLSTIVWNPWHKTAAKMADLGENGYLNMICVESGNAAQDVVNINPGQKHSLYVRYEIEAIE